MKKILLIEDNPTLHDLLKMKLEQAHLSVLSAYDGDEGLTQAREGHPDLVLLDLMLPRQSGLEVFETLRTEAALKNIPVFVISNSGQPEEIEHIKKIGVAGYVIKARVEPIEIINQIFSILQIPQPDAASPEKPATVQAGSSPLSGDARESKKVMIVDDDNFLAQILVSKLSHVGYQTMAVYDGDQVLVAASKEQPDLILLDLIMPKKNGFEALEELKKNPATLHIPVIITSNLGQQEDIIRTKNLGAVDYLIKAEFTPDAIAQKVDHFFGKNIKPA